MIGALDFIAHKLIVNTSTTKRSSDFIAFLAVNDRASNADGAHGHFCMEGRLPAALDAEEALQFMIVRTLRPDLLPAGFKQWRGTADNRLHGPDKTGQPSINSSRNTP